MMKNQNYSKNDLLFYYHKNEFPHNLILKDSLTHKDLLFSDQSNEPETINKKKPKFALSFIIEEELESKKVPFKKGKTLNTRSDHNITKGNAFGAHQNTTWRKNEFEDPGFFDNFKGKSDERQVNTFKRNMELQATQENSFCINNALFVDYLEINNSEKGKNRSLKEIIASADDLFNNTDNLLSGNIDESNPYKNNPNNLKGNNESRKNSYQNIERKTSLNSANNNNNQKDENCASPIKPKFNTLSKEERNLSYVSQDPKKIDFRNIHRINKYLNFSKQDPFWYIFHPIAKSSFGPCSSENLEEMYQGGMVDSQSEVRFIDIYNIKNKKPFEFFKLKDLEDANLINEIEISSLVRNAILLHNQIESNANYNNNNNNFNNSNNNYNYNQTYRKNSNNNNNNQNKNKKYMKNSSNANSNAHANESSEPNKEANQPANAKVNSTNEQPKETKKTEKKEPIDLNSLLEMVLKNDIKNKDKDKDKKSTNTSVAAKAEENKSEKKESTPPSVAKAAEKELFEPSNIPSIEEVINKENANKTQKDKVNRNKKQTKAKPIGLDIKLNYKYKEFEDSSPKPITPSNLASNALTNTNTKPKNQKEERLKTNKAKDSAIQKEEIFNSIYSSKTPETTEPATNQLKTAKTEVKVNSTDPNNTGIETIKVTYDESIYNTNYGYDQEYYNNYEYYGSGTKNASNQPNNKKNTKKQKNKNSNDKNDNYGYEYQYDEGYGNNNYQGSNKNYYNNYGGYNNKQGYKGNNNNNNNNNNNYEY